MKKNKCSICKGLFGTHKYPFNGWGAWKFWKVARWTNW